MGFILKEFNLIIFFIKIINNKINYYLLIHFIPKVEIDVKVWLNVIWKKNSILSVLNISLSE